jgi:hypothetical protein
VERDYRQNPWGRTLQKKKLLFASDSGFFNFFVFKQKVGLLGDTQLGFLAKEI